MKELSIIDKDTGEIVDLTKLKKSQIEARVVGLTSFQKANLFTKANWYRRVLKNIEDAVKADIKSGYTIEDVMDKPAFYEDIKISKGSRTAFSEDALMKEGNEKEIELYEAWKELEAKYKRTSSYIKI